MGGTHTKVRTRLSRGYSSLCFSSKTREARSSAWGQTGGVALHTENGSISRSAKASCGLWPSCPSREHRQQCGCRSERLAAAGVAGVAWVCPTGHLQSQALAALEAVGGGPEIDDERQSAIGCRGWLTWLYTQQAIADVQRFAPLIDIAQAHEKVGVFQAGAHEQGCLNRANDFQVSFERSARVGQDI